MCLICNDRSFPTNFQVFIWMFYAFSLYSQGYSEPSGIRRDTARSLFFAAPVYAIINTDSNIHNGGIGAPQAGRPYFMEITKKAWGQAQDGQTIFRYSLTNRSGMQVDCCNIGCSIISVTVPDRNGTGRDVVLGYDTAAEYLANDSYFGSIVGRFGNRIARGRFALNGRTYQLETNDRGNHLHGGCGAYSRRYWTCVEEGPKGLSFCLETPDGFHGYPGDLKSLVSYSLGEDNSLTITYDNTTSQATIANLTNHSYFNLTGDPAKKIHDHTVYIASDYITPTDPDSIPTGELMPVAGTAFDFNSLKPVGQDIDDGIDQLIWAGGYDHNYVLKNGNGVKASAYCAETGILMEIFTDSPGMQFYTSNSLGENVTGKGGIAPGRRSGLCFETQLWPDSINHPNFPSCVVTKSRPQHFTTTFKFSVQ